MSIEIVNIYKSYVTAGRRNNVINGLSFTVPKRVSVGVIGPNGCGKSTLIRLIAGAEEPDEGRIRRNMRLSWPIAFKGASNPNLNGTANTRFCARLYGADPDEAVRFTRAFSGLGEFMEWPVTSYSNGMRSRLSFAMSMAIDFDCLLIDEVLSVGDADFRAKCSAALEERRARSNFLLVSHNLKDIIRLCDRVLILGGDEPIMSDDVPYAVRHYAAALAGAPAARDL